jgi:hypothetical protein
MTFGAIEVLLLIIVLLLVSVGLELGAIGNRLKTFSLVVQRIYERIEYLELDSHRNRDDVSEIANSLKIQIGNLHAIHESVEKMEKRTRPNHDWEKDPDQRSSWD